MGPSNFTIEIAERKSQSPLLLFCSRLLSADNDALYNREFLCEQGLRSAVAKGYVIIAIADGVICGMLRFYPNRRKEQISVYQFAVSEANRGQGVVDAMLRFLCKHYNGAIVCKCPKSSAFNGYFNKTGWKIISECDPYYYWEWRLLS